jgi:outer membrane protein assembly factor BamA
MVLGLVGAAPSPIVKSVAITGDPAVALPTLLAHLSVRPGMRYSDAVRQKDAESVRNFYEARHMELGSIEGGIVPNSIDARSDTAAVKYAVYVARVVSVQIIGSKDVAMLQKLLKIRPGMILNTELVKADEQRLRAAANVANVNPKIEAGPFPGKPQDVTLVWVLNR